MRLAGDEPWALAQAILLAMVLAPLKRNLLVESLWSKNVRSKTRLARSDEASRLVPPGVDAYVDGN